MYLYALLADAAVAKWRRLRARLGTGSCSLQTYDELSWVWTTLPTQSYAQLALPVSHLIEDQWLPRGTRALDVP